MAEIKTKITSESPEVFLNKIKEDQKRKDAFAILTLMKEATNSEPRMWGTAIIGLGDSKYTLSNGKENDWFILGFSPRKQNFALYLMGAKLEKFEALMEKLGKHSRTKGCIHIKKLVDIDTNILKELFETQVKVCKGI